MAADTESSDSLLVTTSSNAAADTPVDGSQEKTPKKTHKAEREKLKRDQLNDLFVELGSMLDIDQQNAGKASVLGDAARVLRDLITQVESLRKDQSALVSEHRYVSSEKNELQEENNSLKSHISELQNELCAKMANNSLGMSHPMANAANPDLATHPTPHHIWNNTSSLCSVVVTHPRNTVLPFHSQHHSADARQGYATPPQELQLFPGASSSPERGFSGLRSDQATSSSLTDSGQLCLSLLQASQEGSSSDVACSRKER